MEIKHLNLYFFEVVDNGKTISPRFNNPKQAQDFIDNYITKDIPSGWCL